MSDRFPIGREDIEECESYIMGRPLKHQERRLPHPDYYKNLENSKQRYDSRKAYMSLMYDMDKLKDKPRAKEMPYCRKILDRASSVSVAPSDYQDFASIQAPPSHMSKNQHA